MNRPSGRPHRADALPAAEYRYRPGQIVPGTDLKIVMPIGSGGMGSVYAVEETSVEALFVMKIIHPELSRESSDRMRERMRREARTLAQLNYKHIVRVYRAGLTTESPPLPFYVMDMLSGHPLSQVLHGHANRQLLPPLDLFFLVAKGLLLALDYAHRHGVIHRDVKPANLFLHRPEGEEIILKLLDFGIMATVAELSDATRLAGDRFAGTYTHAAPEQLRGEPPSPAVDLYAAGLVLYETLTGTHPFEVGRGDPAAWFHAHAHSPPLPIDRVRAVPPDLEALIRGMLAKEPSDRPQPAGEIAKTLATIEEAWRTREPDAFHRPGVELDLDADLGEPLPTNLGSLLEQWVLDGEAHKTESAISEEKVQPPTRSTWGRTMTGKGGPISVVGVFAAAAAFFVLTLVIGRTLFFARDVLIAFARESVDRSPAAKAPALPPPPAERTGVIRSLDPTTVPVATFAALQPAAAPNLGVARSATSEISSCPWPIAPPVPANRPRAVPDCAPPYTIDSLGHRVPKPECL